MEGYRIAQKISGIREKLKVISVGSLEQKWCLLRFYDYATSDSQHPNRKHILAWVLSMDEFPPNYLIFADSVSETKIVGE
jgi:hypothetical protein